MKKKLTTVEFTGTAEQEVALRELIAQYKNVQGNLMPVLQGAQEIYGYLPIEVQKIIAEGLGVSLSEVYGVVSFYSQFALNPKGKVAIGVCLGTACYVKGSGAICDKVAELTGIKPGDISKSGIYSFCCNSGFFNRCIYFHELIWIFNKLVDFIRIGSCSWAGCR